MKHVLVIIPAYNAAEFITETLEGIRRQQGDFITHVVVCDDVSTDTTCKAVEMYQKANRDLNLHLIRRSRNSGYPAAPRNQAVEYAIKASIPFDYLACCDDDDVWLPHKLRGQLDLFSGDPSLGLVYSRGVIIRNEDTDSIVRRRLVDNFWKLMLFFHITVSSVLISRPIAERFAPLFDEDPALRGCSDAVCWATMLSAGVRVGATDTVDLIYRVHKGSLSTRTYRHRRGLQDYLYRTIRRRTGRSAPLLFSCMLLKLIRYSGFAEKMEGSISRRTRPA